MAIDYIINSFKRKIDGSIFFRNQEPYAHQQNPVVYTNGIENKKLRDFICDPDFVINSVTKALNTSDNQPYILGSTVYMSNGYIGYNIEKIIIKGDKINLKFSGDNSLIPLNNVKKVPTEMPKIASKKAVKADKIEDSPFQDIEDKILKSFNRRQIRLEKTLKNRKETMLEFFTEYFSKWNKADNEKRKRTVYVDDNSLQTSVARRRSLGDIYMLAKYYYPKTTLKDVIKMLYIDMSTISHFRTSYCFTINKRVWYHNGNENRGVFDSSKPDEYGYTYQYYLDKLK